jgi:hypothetical protein
VSKAKNQRGDLEVRNMKEMRGKYPSLYATVPLIMDVNISVTRIKWKNSLQP